MDEEDDAANEYKKHKRGGGVLGDLREGVEEVLGEGGTGGGRGRRGLGNHDVIDVEGEETCGDLWHVLVLGLWSLFW